MQCVPGSCLGATQCPQRALSLRSVCFLYLSVSSLLRFEHTVSHCAGLLVLSWNPKHPSWAAVDLGDCPCPDIGPSVGNMNVSRELLLRYEFQVLPKKQDNITTTQHHDTENVRKIHGGQCPEITTCGWEIAFRLKSQEGLKPHWSVRYLTFTFHAAPVYRGYTTYLHAYTSFQLATEATKEHYTSLMRI